jgi:hypothetical protein
MPRSAVCTLVLVAALPLGATGCGGAADPVHRANVICRDASKEARAYAKSHPTPANVDEVNVALQADGKLADRTAKKLDDLPSAGKSFDDFVAAEKKTASLYREEVAAGGAVNVPRFQKLSVQLLAATERAKRTAARARLRECPYKPISAFFVR